MNAREFFDQAKRSGVKAAWPVQTRAVMPASPAPRSVNWTEKGREFRRLHDLREFAREQGIDLGRKDIICK